MTAKLFLTSLCAIALLSCSDPIQKNSQPAPEQPALKEPVIDKADTTTRVRIINGSDASVTVWITLGATSGCLQHVSKIPYVTDSIGNLVGSFILNAKDSTVAYAPAGMGFNGNLSFNTQPMNCPTNQFPNGVNIFEFIVNNSFQSGIPQNTVEISCVAGVNCYIAASLSGGKKWNASSRYPDVRYIYNRGKLSNSGLVGVFPYGCDDCTKSVSPPACAKSDKDRQKYPICNVQRDAKGSGGGLIRVIYKGVCK